eukprot:1149062-Pelagomonas_calceolata.AAC.12
MYPFPSLRLRAHAIGVERACWQTGVNGHCDLCDLQDLQDKNMPFSAIVLVFVLCKTSMLISFLRLLHRRVFLGHGAAALISSEDVSHFLEQDSNHMYYFLSEIMDVFCVASRDQQAEQLNHLAEGQNPM